ncbi:MAG: MFS transporter [Chloroflexi bacterium]|nr:MFS transporter [Chloroflexota bacterium]
MQSTAAKRIIWTLFAAQSLVSAGVIAGATVLSIIAVDLTGNDANAGVPSAVMQLAAAPAAYGFGLLWDRIGRRNGMTLGLLLGVAGGVVAVWAVEGVSFFLLLLSVAGLGFMRSALQLSRFIAAEVSEPSRRGAAISTVVLGGTVGAILGPLVVAPSSQLALALGMNELTGPYLAALALFALTTIVVWLGLNPDPMELSKEIEAQFPEEQTGDGKIRSTRQLLALPGVYVAITTMVIAQMVMVMVMGITSLHMAHLEMTLGSISVVFSGHTLGMFAPSIFSGRLADRWGRAPMIITGAVILLASFVLAPLYPSVPPLVVALFLLGLGWNFCFVAGSALLADQLRTAERSSMQGTNDLLIALVTAGGSFASGPIFASAGYGVLNLSGGVLTLMMLGLVLWWYANSRQMQTAAVNQ